MKKKFTMLFAALLACVGVAKAQEVASTEELSNEKCYTIITADGDSRGTWMYNSEDPSKLWSTKCVSGATVDVNNENQHFAFLKSGENYYLYSVAAKKFVVKQSGSPAAALLKEYPEHTIEFFESEKTGYMVVAVNGGHIGISTGFTPQGGVITHYNDLNDGGNSIKITEAGAFNAEEALAKIALDHAAERNALFDAVEAANAIYSSIEDKSNEKAIALKANIDAAVAEAEATTTTAESLTTLKTALEEAVTACDLLVYNLLEEFDLSTQIFNLKNASTGLYMTIVATEGTNNNAGGLQIKALEENNAKQMFSFVAADDKYKIKSSEGFYLTAFSAWGYKATETDSDDAIHEIAYVGKGKYTLKSTLGFVGSNSGATSDGSPMYSNHGNSNPNIYWTLEPLSGTQEQLLKASLLAEIENATEFYNNQTDKNLAEVVALNDAIVSAQETYNKATATLEEINEQITGLSDAVALIQNYSPYFPSMLKEITAGKYLIYYTEGETKHYLQTSGANSVVTVTENPQKYEVSAGTIDGGKYTKSYLLKMNNLYISNTSLDATNIETKAGAQLWSSQVVFEKEGKCAIRLTNATDVNGWHGNYFIGKGAETGTTIALAPETSLSDVFIWTFEEVTMSEAEIAAEELGTYLEAFYANYYDAWGSGWRNTSGVNNYSQPEGDQPLNEAYEEVKTFYDAINEETTAEAINEKKDYLEGLEANLKINQPEEGKFYRLRCVANKNYLSSVVSAVSDSDSQERFEISSSNGAEAMFMYDGESLLSYTEGLYANTHAFTAVGAQKSSVVFTAAANGAIGQYNINLGGRYIYGQGNTKNNHVDSGAGSPTATNTSGYNWWLEEVTTLPVTITSAGYATFYAPVALTIADGVKAYTAAVEGATLTLNEIEGTVIPAETGVILEAEANTYNFAVAADVDAIADNALVGSFAKSAKNAEAKVYTLQAPAQKEVGFYLFKGYTDEADQEGTKTYINGFRAWIEVAADEEAPAMFTLGRGGEDEDATAIDQFLNANGELVIYDLSGRRVQKMEKGIYIVNGKKVVK